MLSTSYSPFGEGILATNDEGIGTVEISGTDEDTGWIVCCVLFWQPAVNMLKTLNRTSRNWLLFIALK
jgi:hypothetical protein